VGADTSYVDSDMVSVELRTALGPTRANRRPTEDQKFVLKNPISFWFGRLKVMG
jgi:hypothetical protein